MFWYILKKVVQAAFVVVSVVSFVYILQYSGPIDPVEDMLISSFGDRSYDQSQFKQSYEKEARRQHLHLPLFYFSVKPSYFPDDVHETLVRADRRHKKQLLRLSRCASCVEDYLEARDLLISQIEDGQIISSEQRRDLNKYNVEYNTTKINELIDQLSRQYSQDSILGFTVQNAASSWKALVTVNQSSKWSYPKWRWYGMENRFHKYIIGIFQGRFGTSKTDGLPASSKIFDALKWTLSINVTSFILAGTLGLLLAIWSMKKDDTAIESSVSGFFYLWYTMPIFWSATLLVIFFTTDEYGAWTNIFPSVGIKYWYSDKPISTQILLNARQLILPVICLTLPSLAYVSRIMKSKFQEVGSKEFITALKAKGLSDTQILNKHIVKNGLIPFITIMTGSITKVFAGSLVLEIIFNVPGVGKLMYDSILSSDWAVISGLVIMLSLVTVIAYIIADLLYSWANPRIQLVTTDDMI